MIEYYVKRKGGTEFEVAKFTGDSTPEATYQVDWSSSFSKGRCDCMAYRSGKTRPCKHMKLVQAFILQGEPEGHCYSPQEGDR